MLSFLNQKIATFYPPGEPIIMVRKLTMEIIKEAIQTYATHRQHTELLETGNFGGGKE